MKIVTLPSGQEKFKFYSIRERISFIQLAKTQGWKITNMSDANSADGWDVIYTDQNGIRNIAELKVRKKFSDAFGGNKWIFEKRKYDELNLIAKSPVGEKALLQSQFILFLFDCVLIFDVNNINDEEWFTELLRAESVGGEDKVKEKLITHLNGQNAVRNEYKLNFDTINDKALEVFNFEFPNNTVTLNEYD